MNDKDRKKSLRAAFELRRTSMAEPRIPEPTETLTLTKPAKPRPWLAITAAVLFAAGIGVFSLIQVREASIRQMAMDETVEYLAALWENT